MIYVGIDVAKDKHDCIIKNSVGEVVFKAFTIKNNLDGFNNLYQRIESVMEDVSKVKVGLEATGHYSYNLLGYLIDKGLPTFVINPLHTNLYRKSLSLRQTKTDKVDASTIASMLMSDVNLKSYSDTSYHNEELKSRKSCRPRPNHQPIVSRHSPSAVTTTPTIPAMLTPTLGCESPLTTSG